MYFPLSAVVIEFLILEIVKRQDCYGYEITQRLKRVAVVKEASLYPILKRMVDGGFLTTYIQEYQGRTRKYYQMTDQGEAKLKFLTIEWKFYLEGIEHIRRGEMK